MLIELYEFSKAMLTTEMSKPRQVRFVFEVGHCSNQNRTMSSVTRRFLFNNQSVYILNRLYNPQPCVNCVRKSHVLRNKFLSITDSRLTALASVQNACNALNSVDYIPVRLKYDKKSSKHDDDEDSDEDESNLDEFRDGDKSDRNLATIKVQTLRLDTVIKAGLGYTKK